MLNASIESATYDYSNTVYEGRFVARGTAVQDASYHTCIPVYQYTVPGIDDMKRNNKKDKAEVLQKNKKFWSRFTER